MPKIIAALAEVAVFVLLMWVLTFLPTFLHELGHALGYMLSTGDRHWHIRVGFGKKLLETKPLTVKLLVFDGCFEPAENKIDSKAKLISTLAGGPAVSLILVIVMLLVRSGTASFSSGFFAPGTVKFFADYLLYLNLFIFVYSLLPVHYAFGEIRGMESDGLQILNAVKHGKKS